LYGNRSEGGKGVTTKIANRDKRGASAHVGNEIPFDGNI